MPKLKAVVAKLEEVPEALRELYTEQDGRFVLDAEGVEDVGGLKSALQKQKDEVRKAREALAKYGGADPERVAELLAAAEEAERKQLQVKGDWEKRETQLQEQFKKTLGQKDERIGKLERAIQRHAVQREAIAAITAAEGRATLLLPHVERQLKLVEEGDEFAVVVVDGKGSPRIKDSAGHPMTVTDLVMEMKASEEFAAAFKGSGASGGGAQGGGGAGGRPGVIRRDDVKAIAANADKIVKGEVKVE